MKAIDYLVNLKTEFVKLQKFEVCYYLRGLENKFNGNFDEKYLEPTYDNFLTFLANIIEKETILEETKLYFKTIIRDIKIKRLIGEI